MIHLSCSSCYSFSSTRALASPAQQQQQQHHQNSRFPIIALGIGLSAGAGRDAGSMLCGASRPQQRGHASQQDSGASEQQCRRQWEQQFADCYSWQQLYTSGQFLQRPVGQHKAVVLMAAAAMLARMVRQQPAGPTDADDADREQERAGAQQLWIWFMRTVLGPRLVELLPQQQQQQPQGAPGQQPQQRQGDSQPPEMLSTVAAAALLHAIAAMGWTDEDITELTGSAKARTQLTGRCLDLFKAGLTAAFAPGAQHQQQQQHRQQPTLQQQQQQQPVLQQAVPSIAVVNLVCAMHAVGVKVSGKALQQQQNAALKAVLRSSSSTSISSRGARRVLGCPALVKLLESFVSTGERMPGDVLCELVACFQVHINSRPHLLLPLLYRLNRLRERQLCFQGLQLLQDFKVQLLLGLQNPTPPLKKQQRQQQPHAALAQQEQQEQQEQQQQEQPQSAWHLLPVLQYQAVAQLFGHDTCQQLQQAASSNGSSSRGSARQGNTRHFKGRGARAAGSSAPTDNSSSSNSSQAVGRLSNEALQQLLGSRQLPLTQASFKDLVLLSEAVAQLPPRRDLWGLKQLLMRVGVKFLHRAALAAQQTGRRKRNGIRLQPGEVSSWLEHMANMRAWAPEGCRQRLAEMLLDLLSAAAAAATAGDKVPAGFSSSSAAAASLPSPSSSAAAAAAAAADSRHARREGDKGDSTSSDGSDGSDGSSWTAAVLVQLVTAACDLSLPHLAGPEWWPAVLAVELADQGPQQQQQQPRQQHRRQQQQQQRRRRHTYTGSQVLLLLQCMARSKHRPQHYEVTQLLQMLSEQWFDGSSTSSSDAGSSGSNSGGGARSSSNAGKGRQAAAGPTLLQLVDLLCVLVSLKHTPHLPGANREGWWDAWQASVLQCAQQQQQQGRQQQQQQLQLPYAVPAWQQTWWEQQQAAVQQQQQQLDAAAAGKVLWAAGRLRLNLGPQLLPLVLERVQGHLHAVDYKQLVGVMVGLASVVKANPGAVSGQLYRQLCQRLRQGEPGPEDVANLIRCFASIAASTGAADASAAAAAAAEGQLGLVVLDSMELDAAVGEAGNLTPAAQQQQERQQPPPQPQQERRQPPQPQPQPLLPPALLVSWLLARVEREMGELSGQALTMMLWGLRKLGHIPPQHWLDRYQQVVLQQATGVPGLPDHQCAIIVSSMVHLGLPVNLDLLQQLLFRAPRENMSPGIVADLTAALRKLEQVEPQQWEAQLLGQQQQQGAQQQRGRPEGDGGQQQPQWRARWQLVQAQRAQQQQQQLAASGRHVAVPEGPDLDLDALIDSARDELGFVLGLGRQQPAAGQEEDGFVPLAAVPTTASAEEQQQLDADTQERLRTRLAIAQELVDDSMAAGGPWR